MRQEDNNYKIDIGLGEIVIPKVNKFPKDDVAAVGMFEVTKSDLEQLKSQNRKVRISVTGVLKIGKDVEKELFLETVSSVTVSGIVNASKELKEVIKDYK